ncbi:MAG: hypothetical protein HYX24_01655 [Candidatus Aenigmarchaeota archaeon]|nr:hypothetical protein [Candidatus Aenigmarchaeota archaeon]
MKTERSFRAMMAGIICSFALSSVFSLLLSHFGLRIEVILPTTAPIFACFATLIFMALKG